MQQSGREPSMEDILASIKRVIAEEKELRVSARDAVLAGDSGTDDGDDLGDDVLELDQPLEPEAPLAPPIDLGPPLLDAEAIGESRKSFEALSTVAAAVPALPQANPLEEVVRDMLRPLLKQWVDEHLPQIVSEHVRAEISRITGRSG